MRPERSVRPADLSRVWWATLAAMSTWLAPDRRRTPRVPDERTSLESWLEYHRATLLIKCAGLTADQLVTRSCPPSPLSLLGLVRHMAEVEAWFHVFDAKPAGQHLYTDHTAQPPHVRALGAAIPARPASCLG